MSYKYKELHQAVECNKSGENKKAKALWTLQEAKDKGIYMFTIWAALQRQRRLGRIALWLAHCAPCASCACLDYCFLMVSKGSTTS